MRDLGEGRRGCRGERSTGKSGRMTGEGTGFGVMQGFYALEFKNEIRRSIPWQPNE